MSKTVWKWSKRLFYISACFYIVVSVFLSQQLPDESVTYTASRHVPMVMNDTTECVIILHGAFSRGRYFESMGNALKHNGYLVYRTHYAWNRYPLEKMSEATSKFAEGECKGRTTHFVVQSSGAIILRHMFAFHPIPNKIGRIVMISPINNGSELVTYLKWIPGFTRAFGPLISKIGTFDSDLPARLPKSLPYEVGLITGNQHTVPIISMFLPNPNDGLVSYKSSHAPFIAHEKQFYDSYEHLPDNPEVINSVISFLKTADFDYSKETKAWIKNINPPIKK